MSVKATYTTMGQASPASVASGTGYYVYRGKQPHKPPRPNALLPQNAKASAGKRERFAEYVRLRTEEKLTVQQAAGQIPVHISTARCYERELKEQQREAGAFGPPLSDACSRDDCGACFPDELGGCGCGHHDDEGRPAS